MVKQRVLQGDKCIKEIIEELNHLKDVPMMDVGPRTEQALIAMSIEHINERLLLLADEETFLLERLKHSETERFNR